ncbi:MAG: tetratricopeptide repeat protein, partial [Bacteroidota bacterium]
VYQKLGNTQKAKLYFKQFLDLSRKNEIETLEAKALVNMGAVLVEEGKHNLALANFEQALKVYEKNQDKNGMAAVYNNIGDTYRGIDDYDNALKYQNRSLRLKREIEDKRGMASSINNIGRLHLSKGDYEQALIFFKRGLQLSSELGAKDFTRDAYAGLSDLYAAKNDFKQAYKYYRLHNELKDSLYLSSGALADIFNRYGADKKELQIRLANAQSRSQSLSTWNTFFLILLILCGVLLGLSGAYIWYSRKKMLNLSQKTEPESSSIDMEANPKES